MYEAPITLTMLKLESMVNRFIAEVVTGNGRPTEELIAEMREVIINPDLHGVPVEDLEKYRKRFMRQA